VDLLVLIAPMIPVPGEAPADYWTDTRFVEEVRESYDDEIALFYQDVPPELASEALKRGRTQSEPRMHEPLPLEAWPDMPTRSCSVGTIACSRLPSFAASPLERLAITPDEIEGGHTPALSRPEELANRLEAYAAQAGIDPGVREAKQRCRPTGSGHLRHHVR
jgi:hypothetical protein